VRPTSCLLKRFAPDIRSIRAHHLLGYAGMLCYGRLARGTIGRLCSEKIGGTISCIISRKIPRAMVTKVMPVEV
jgi:hypothetical protein